jgi:limonene-1,2-epoxide hydrolase
MPVKLVKRNHRPCVLEVGAVKVKVVLEASVAALVLHERVEPETVEIIEAGALSSTK